METRIPRYPGSEEMGSRSVAPSQDEAVDIAAAMAPTSHASIARSMSRYKGGRRNQRSYEPPMPAIGLAGVKQNSLGRGNGPGPGDVEGVRPIQDDSPRFTHGSRANDPQPSRSMFPRNKPGQDSRTGHGHELPPAEADVESSNTRALRHKPQLAAEDEHGLTGAFHGQLDAIEQGETDVDLGRRRTPRYTVRREHRPSRSSHGRAQNIDEVTGSESRAGAETAMDQKAGSFSQRMAAQPRRPQAFRSGSSREELKRMISGPKPMVAQEAVPSPPRKQVEPRIGSSHSHTSPELSLAPRFDAPVSAVNAGQRIVRVKYDGNDIFLPITPSTTPVDIIRAAARQLSAPVSENSTVLLESFKQVGLERPLRKYEHIRDVLNSWDNDAQNTLVIIPSPSGGKDDDLDARNVPKRQPGETTVYLYHSQRPGSWSKRWITLRSDGQVIVAKKRGGETSNICHLSDFDIYIPTPRYASKKIKPPKKVCFAVKSQQKSSMFMTTENFVHFFCTSDRSLGTAWYTAVQEWRSWYLVNVMGEGQQSASEDNANVPKQPPLGNRPPALSSYAQPSKDGAPRPQEAPALETSGLPIRTRTVRSTAPVSARKLTKDPLTKQATTHRSSPSIYQTPAAASPPIEPFEPEGLLGRTYTMKREAQQRSQAPPTNDPPPIPAVVPRNDSPLQKEVANGLKRHSSQRHKPKPLVDLTPVYQEPPQHSRKGRGVIPAQVPAGGLVEVATSPENPIDAPPATTWRKLQ